MFTDTKNLANLTVNTTNAAAKQNNTHNTQEEDKFKLKKMWKPIIRLMSRKSALAKNGKRDNNSSIPNNVNLNNASQYSSLNKDTLADLDDTSHMNHKLTLAEFWQAQQQQYQTLQQQQQQTSTETLEFISKASIDKTPLDTCTNCVYGRNCQHTQFHQTEDVNISSQYHAHSHSLLDLQQPHNVNYFDAEDGCFVWSDNNSDIDENALREWLWQNSWQFAENATVC